MKKHSPVDGESKEVRVIFPPNMALQFGSDHSRKTSKPWARISTTFFVDIILGASPSLLAFRR